MPVAPLSVLFEPFRFAAVVEHVDLGITKTRNIVVAGTLKGPAVES
jgi:hypothetical protein